MLAESILEGVIADTVVKGGTRVVAYAFDKGRFLLDHHGGVSKALKNDRDFAKAAQRMAASIAALSPEAALHRDAVPVFLKSPQVAHILRQMYAAEILAEEGDDCLPALRRDFLALWDAQVGLPAGAGEQMFDLLQRSCEQVLGILTRQGLLSEMDRKQAYRHRSLLAALAQVRKEVASLREPPRDPEATKAFVRDYCHVLAEINSHLLCPVGDAFQPIPLADIYVEPKLTKQSSAGASRAQGSKETLSVNDFRDRFHRAVVLAPPGGGKSTLMQKLIHRMALAPRTEHFIPFLVLLRDFALKRRLSDVSIAGYLTAQATSTYQVPCPSGVIEELFGRGQAVVVFDGLDEILDTAQRRQIATEIEAFCHRFPSVAVLVTSREQGYDQTPLNPALFETFRLADFSPEAVAEYVRKWFRRVEKVEGKEYDTARFLQESSGVPDLQGNPLMLALMCSIYRGEGYIPRNRPAVYEKCANMLFERWDRSRGINSAPPLYEARMRDVVCFMAFRIYESPHLQGGAPRSVVCRHAASYMEKYVVDDAFLADRAAQDFIDYCRGRAWIFTVAGVTPNGEEMYQFVHRTFLEYFAAAYLVRVSGTMEDLLLTLEPRIRRAEWDVVAQLALQIHAQSKEGGADAVLGYLLSRTQVAARSDANNLLSFAARSLGFLLPSPRTVRLVVARCVEQSGIGGPDPRWEIVRPLWACRPENRVTVREEMDALKGRLLLSGSQVSHDALRELSPEGH